MISIISKSTIIRNVLRVLGLFDFFSDVEQSGRSGRPYSTRDSPNHHTAQTSDDGYFAKSTWRNCIAASKDTVVIEYHGAEAIGKSILSNMI